MWTRQKARLSLESWNLLNDNTEQQSVATECQQKCSNRVCVQQSVATECDFPRKCRDVVDLDRWKASELRQFLLYIGPVVLQDILHPDVYECFMYFSAVHLFSQHYAYFLIDVSKVAVSKFAAIFGPSHLVFNVHFFSHLSNFVKLYGCLDRFPCFPYKSELRHLKHYIHGPKPPAVQLYRRLAERVRLDAVERKTFLDDVGLRLRPSATAGCHNFIHRNIVFSKNFPDNCILLDSQQAVILNFSGDTTEYKKFKTVLPSYTHVLISTDVLVFQCSNLQHARLVASVDQISCKCLRFSHRDSYILPHFACPYRLKLFRMHRVLTRKPLTQGIPPLRSKTVNDLYVNPGANSMFINRITMVAVQRNGCRLILRTGRIVIPVVTPLCLPT
ncbi:hypothetical protein T265_08831 [Opisthorchis viverrini]|uniref:Uncharacterized protein n=1 Tax=Opisthorchis viverrini TaxID=6198 RepID=A0A075A748_OPIVI|nr:hypothetical protein T265_08831 [Opisthorchis viverrini]KER23259.1 hypothetical protein T265_08831 [Opisthorchis viverrini]